MLALFTTSVSGVVNSDNNKYEEISDFSNNTFLLSEGHNSYEIYDQNGTFIEGSNKTNSPFYLINGEKHYLGPGNYFTKDNNNVLNLLTNDYSEYSDYIGAKYVLDRIPNKTKGTDSSNDHFTYVDSNGFTVINRADYFRKLKFFPKNWFGECGLISLSILLGYYDTFYNDDFIPNNVEFDARYYRDENADRKNGEKPVYILDYRKTEYLTHYVETPYLNVENYDFTSWTQMPGTTYAMRDYLFDGFKHTYLGLGWDDVGYPMLDGELKGTMYDYMLYNCEDLLEHTKFHDGHLLFTHQKPREYIDKGIPVSLVLKSYESSVGSGNTHIVTAYGYKNDTFLAHFGWWPNTFSGTEVVINSATIYGYFAMEYNGEHKHSSNISMNNQGVTRYICGCGCVHKSSYLLKPTDWGFDSRYYFANEGIKTQQTNVDDLVINTKRLRCGLIENQFINLSPNRYGAGDSYLELSFNKKVHGMNTHLSYWSFGESIFSNLGDYAYVQYRDDNGVWYNLVDLLSCGLSMDREKQDFFEFMIPEGTKMIRFIAHKDKPDTYRNKGRISIGDTTFIC